MLENYQIKTLMLIHELEKSLGEMYTIFRELFPEYNNLWSLLIKEEYGHSEAVRKLYKMTYEGKVLFREGNIKPEGVQSVVDYLKTVHDNARLGRYTTEKALIIAYDVERSIIEKDIFDHFNVAPELANMLNILIIGTKRHAELIKEKIDKLK